MRVFNKGFGTSAIVAMLILLAPASSPAASPTEGVDWGQGVISVVGEGVPPQDGSPAKRRLLAKRAAVVDGYRKLAEVVKGVQITSETRVKELEVESDEIRSSVSALVKGAQIVDENITSDGAYEVRINLPLFGDNSLASTVLLTSLNKRKPSIPQPESPSIPQDQATSSGMLTSLGERSDSGQPFSGVVIDARNLKVKAALMPALFTESGREIYFGSLSISNDDLVAQGPVSYAKSLEEAKSHPRIGSIPLVIRAKRFKGPFQADLILADQDAKRLEAADRLGAFLKNMAVVIVQ